jgi:hypothetical protein
MSPPVRKTKHDGDYRVEWVKHEFFSSKEKNQHGRIDIQPLEACVKLFEISRLPFYIPE